MDHLATILKLDNAQSEFDWNRDLATDFSSILLTNNRLLNVLIRIGYKAVMGVAAALTELIQLRSKNSCPHIDVTQEFAPKIDALWAAAIDPLYLKSSDFEYRYIDENGVKSVFSSNWFILGYIAGGYADSSYYIHPFLVNLPMLARHLMPDRNLFDKWFTETIRKTAETFPCLYSYSDLNWKEDKNAVYDCSDDAPVPREFFFDPEFVYSKEAAKPLLNTFLQSLDYNNNPWLCTPEEMMAKGFKGTPYKV